MSPRLEQQNRQSAYRLEVSPASSISQIVRRLEHLTFPSLRQRTQTQGLHEPLQAVAVTFEEEPVGLALAHGTPGKSASEIVSLYVRRDHRGRGLSGALLSGMEHLLVQQGYQKVRLAYRSDWPAAPIVERRLNQLKWMPPEANLMLGKFSAHEVAASWETLPLNHARLPEGAEIIPWSEITEREIESCVGENECDDPEEFAPFEEPDRIEPLNSLALRCGDKIVGWILTHRLDHQTIQYTRLHVAPPFQRLGRGLPLIAAALRRQIEAGIPFGVFQVRSDNPRMLQLIERRLKPFIGTWTESRRSEKALQVGNKQRINKTRTK